LKIASWIPFPRKTEEADGQPGRGPLTGCDLGELTALTLPLARDPFQRLRPPFSREAAELSLELADVAYTLELEPWKAAGWNDFSVLIDDRLQSGLTHWESGEGLGRFINTFRLVRARAALKEYNPVSQVLGALRQREKSDTVKAVCMMHPLPGGRWMLAIGFMGTGKRLYDWISNFRFTPVEGFHRGFSELCESFESNVDSIVFPAAAADLGLDRLTLGDVLSDMRGLSSPFRLWMAGHSQGGAVMQVFAHRLLMDWGVAPQNMVGYGFASPTVATGRFVYDPAAYPLYHIVNRDDYVPRMGALLHLGLCAEFPADEAFRQAVYAPPGDAQLHQRLAFAAHSMVDTPTCLLCLTALLQCLVEEKGMEALGELLGGVKAMPAAVERAIGRAGDKAADWAQRGMEGARGAYEALCGHPMSEDELARMREGLRPIVRETPLRKLMNALADYGVPPHMLAPHRREGQGAYTAIVRDGLDALRPFVWQKQAQGLPTRQYGEWRDAEGAAAPRAAVRARRGRAVRPVPRGKLRLSYHARFRG